MNKILKVIDSKLLPDIDKRESNIVYFVYDKMSIYLGKNFYSDPFCIVDILPENPVEGMLYITLDGKLKSYINYNEIEIGQIESEDQIEYLKKAGTVYFMKAEYRYLDLQTRTLQLPFQNGTYQLSVSMAKDLIIDENTIIKYNPEKRLFEINNEGNNSFKGYQGLDSDTIKTTVTDNNILSELKISPNKDNLIKVLNDGLYADLDEFTRSNDFKNLVNAYNAYKTSIKAYLIELEKEIEDIEYKIEDTTVASKIMEELKNYEPTIEDMLANYDYIYNQLGLIREGAVNYIDEKFDSAKQEIIDYISKILNAWEDFEVSSDINILENKSFMSEAECELQSDLLEEMRKQFMYLRKIEGTETVDFNFFIVTDNNKFDNMSTIEVLPNLLDIISEQAKDVGYTRLIISQEKESIENKYYWKITEEIPKYNSDVTHLGFIEWDGKSDLEIPNGSSVILVESDDRYHALRFGRFIANSRLTEAKELDILDIISAEGTSLNSTKIIISPEKEENNIYMYKKASTIPEYNSTVSTDYIEWDGISELDLSVNDMDLLCFVECTKDFHKALKVGLIKVDLTNELLKLLVVVSQYGSSVYQSIINVTPNIISGNRYFYKLSETNSLPSLNTYITSDNDWIEWDGEKEIFNALFYPYILIAECDNNDRLKKVGYTKIITNNDLQISLSYNEDTYMQNSVHDYINIGNNSLYYKLFDITEDINHLYANENLSSDYISFNYETEYINIEKNCKIAIAEVNNLTNKIQRFGIFNPEIKYSEELSFSINLVDNNLSITDIMIDNNYEYAVKLLMNDDEQPILNQPIEITDKYIIWDGVSTVEILDSDSIIGVRIYQIKDNIIGYSGKVLL